jgi:asparagine N-glycosylation enzyme membrane subunit Stt3
MVRWLGAMLAAAIMSVFAVLLLTGDYVREGPVLVRLSTTHGIHRGDLGIVSLWTLGMLSLLAVVIAGRPRR